MKLTKKVPKTTYILEMTEAEAGILYDIASRHKEVTELVMGEFYSSDESDRRNAIRAFLEALRDEDLPQDWEVEED